MTTTADTHRKNAEAARAEANASFERCDTDGFATQAAHNIRSEAEELKALVADNDGVWDFEALFDLDGNLVPAKEVKTRFGWAWGFLSDADNPNSRFTGWFSPSKARDRAVRVRNDARKGYYVGKVRVAAHVVTSSGGGYGMSGLASVHSFIARDDRGFSPDAEIVDNGQPS